MPHRPPRHLLGAHRVRVAVPALQRPRADAKPPRRSRLRHHRRVLRVALTGLVRVHPARRRAQRFRVPLLHPAAGSRRRRRGRRSRTHPLQGRRVAAPFPIPRGKDPRAHSALGRVLGRKSVPRPLDTQVGLPHGPLGAQDGRPKGHRHGAHSL
eukprot:Amastigsp_a678820_5.p5 type:complete len:154 gc:universal Amastigsp_a678820_5:524-985(+)